MVEGEVRAWTALSARNTHSDKIFPPLLIFQAARLGLAVVLAPAADRLLDGTRSALGLGSKRAAFGVCVAALCAVATVVLVGTTAAWA